MSNARRRADVQSGLLVGALLGGVVVAIIAGYFGWADWSKANTERTARAERIFSQFDRNGDDLVHLEEVFEKRHRSLAKIWLIEQLQVSAADGSSVEKDLSEWDQILNSDDWPCDLAMRLGFRFAKIDRNDDGAVSKSEFFKTIS